MLPSSRVVGCLTVLLALGCKSETTAPPSGSSSAKPGPIPSASAANQECASHTEKLTSWLQQTAAEGSGPPDPFRGTGITLVEQTSGQKNRFGLALLLKEDSPKLDFDSLRPDGGKPSKDPLLEALQQRRQSAIGAGFSLSGIDVYLDKTTTWNTVVASLDAVVKSGLRNVQLVFASPSKSEPPKSSPAMTKLEAAEKESESSESADDSPIESVAAEIFQQCSSGQGALKEIGQKQLSPDERAGRFAKLIGPALAACQCHADLDAVRALQWYWLGRNNGPPTVGVTLRLAGPADKDTHKLALPKTMPWSEAVAPVLEATRQQKPVTLTIK